MLSEFAFLVLFLLCMRCALSDLDVGTNGAYTIHGDAMSTDTTPLEGPGAGPVKIQTRSFLAACSTILIRSDKRPMVLSTSFFGRDPVARLLKSSSGRQEAQLRLESVGNVLGSVYAYLDSNDRLVMVEGPEQNLIWIKAQRKWPWLGRFSPWELVIDEQTNLGNYVTDSIVSISPGPNGKVWFVTRDATLGVYDPDSGEVETIQLNENERVDNSFSSTANGKAAVVTDKALYVADASAGILWRQEYDRGSARKPGNFAWGSGTTPTIFRDDEYVAIADNADEGISLIVRSMDNGDLICKLALFSEDNSGTENSFIGYGNTLVIASTYGYEYPAYPEGTEASVPEEAPFVGGMVAVTVQDGSCSVQWENDVRSTAVPKLSTADNLIYTFELCDDSGLIDKRCFVAIDFETGETITSTQVPLNWLLGDTLQQAGNVGSDQTFWQGDIDGILRVEPQ